MRVRLQALLATEPYQEARPLMLTTYERGIIEGRREVALLLLEAKFGPLSPEVKQKVQGFTSEQLIQLAIDIIKGKAFQELRLAD